MATFLTGAITLISPSADGKCKMIFTANNSLVMVQQNQDKAHSVEFNTVSNISIVILNCICVYC